MGSASSSMDTTSDLDKKIQMVQLFRGMRGYGRTRYVQKPCPIESVSIDSELSFRV